jgi:hypothetical protein
MGFTSTASATVWMHPRAPGVVLLILFFVISVEARTTEVASTLQYRCDRGVTFQVDIRGRRARISTSVASYDVVRVASSIGVKFSSADVTFIRDEDRGVLTGASGGPFRGCHER